jgi:hypothetical protein
VTEQEKPKLLLISPAVEAVVPAPEIQLPVDREGAEEHGRVREAIKALVGRATKIESIDPEVFAERLSTSVADAAKAVQAKIFATIGQFSVEEVAISLAVTAEGDIGIASAGMKASIEVTLKRRSEAGA